MTDEELAVSIAERLHGWTRYEGVIRLRWEHPDEPLRHSADELIPIVLSPDGTFRSLAAMRERGWHFTISGAPPYHVQFFRRVEDQYRAEDPDLSRAVALACYAALEAQP